MLHDLWKMLGIL